MNNDFIKVDVREYVSNGINSGYLVPFSAEKVGKILARQGMVGEEVVTWIVGENGEELQECIANVDIDENTNLPGWIVTKADMDGNAVIDKNGHNNSWIVPDSIFKSKYIPDSNMDMVYIPKANVQVFVKVHDNIIIDKNGVDMKIEVGGFINITNDDNMYGISDKDFNDTYIRCDELEKDEPVYYRY